MSSRSGPPGAPEGVRRFGEARILALLMQQFPAGGLSFPATTTEFESRHLGHFLTFRNGFSLFPVLARLPLPIPPVILKGTL